MSHFSVVVFTKTGKEDEVERLLAPYDENGEWFADGSRWDWWVIGGRWDGVLLGLEPIDGQNGFNFGGEFHTLVRNSAKPSAFSADFRPFAFVTPDGMWTESARMGWWATTSGDQDEEAWQLQWDQANRQDREVRAKAALVEQLRAQREEAAREHLAQTRTWLQQWRNGRERLAHYDRTLLPLAAERTRAAMAAYRGGNGSLGSVLDARRNEIEQRTERLRLEMDTAAMWAQLQYLLPADHERAAPPASASLSTLPELPR